MPSDLECYLAARTPRTLIISKLASKTSSTNMECNLAAKTAKNLRRSKLKTRN